MRALMIFAFFLIIIPFKSNGQCFSLTLTVVPPTCLGCCDGSATVENLTGGCPPYAINWSGGSAIPEETGFCFDVTYTLTIIDAYSCCPDTTVELIINSSTNILNVQSESSFFDLYPNPAIDNLFIDIAEKATVEIINMQGQIVARKTLSGSSNSSGGSSSNSGGSSSSSSSSSSSIDVSELRSGVYTLRMKTEKGIVMKKMVKQ